LRAKRLFIYACFLRKMVVNIYLSSQNETTSDVVVAGIRVNRLFIYACFLMHFLMFIAI
jgi:hypothetical protein